MGHVIPLPADAGGESDNPDDAADPFAGLKAQIRDLRGRTGLVETTSSGFAEGRAAAPAQDWKPRRIGADPPEVLATLRDAVESTVLGCCGVPPDLARPGGRTRESYRQWAASSVEPLARLVAAELSRALDVEVRLRFDRLEAADVAGRARAYRSLVGTGGEPMPDADAGRLVGFA